MGGNAITEDTTSHIVSSCPLTQKYTDIIINELCNYYNILRSVFQIKSNQNCNLHQHSSNNQVVFLYIAMKINTVPLFLPTSTTFAMVMTNRK